MSISTLRINVGAVKQSLSCMQSPILFVNFSVVQFIYVNNKHKSNVDFHLISDYDYIMIIYDYYKMTR